MNRTLRVIQMQLVNRQTFIWLPLIILGGALAVSLAIHAILRSSGVEVNMYGGGAQAPLWYFLAVGVYSLTLSFPFSQAMSVTRREFYLGTLLTAGLTALIMAIVFVLGGLLEIVTGGWGINAYFFRLDWIWEPGAFAAGLFFFTLAMLFFTVGFWCATIYKRFGPMGLTIALLGVGVVLLGVLWLIGQAQAWGEVFGWLATQGSLSLTLWGLLLTAVLAASAFPMLRRMVA
ncbi:hypothetical protein E4V99_06100 [Microbacterium sp. dk485]|uniref:hypothetical protein n=1 Tax=Microbacterium TaxID=33882 RepID=UPI001073A9BB|nr:MULTISPECIES: hypothetical protein [Microbacterium]TFV84620.1 hypothetical protein E4V99_06100 [Microbacterium sp. dk485]TXK14598.1 hypothetical protein FVP99_12900 [Microbacterium wangchenii]